MISLDGLLPEFRTKIESLMDSLNSSEFTFRISFALRTPIDQAKLWRQGRSKTLINARIGDLEAQDCDYLAQCLKDAGPQNGPIVTNALPGLSWHQYGQAADVLAYDTSGRLITSGDDDAYKKLEEAARLEGLTTGRSWGDAGHIQASQLSKPQYDLKTINDMMRDKFSTKGRD